MNFFEAGLYLAGFLLLFQLLLDKMDAGDPAFEVYAIFIFMLMALALFMNAAVEAGTGDSIGTYVKKRRSLPRQYRRRVKE